MNWNRIAAFCVMIVLILCAAVSLAADITWSVKLEDGEKFSLWTDPDGAGHLFLPSYADLSSLYSSKDCTVNGVSVGKGEVLPVLEPGKEFALAVKSDSSEFSVHQSAGLWTMVINTKSGNTNMLNYARDEWEKCTVILKDEAGEILYQSGKNDAQIRGRGHSTWELDKKPYSVKLNQKADLLGTGASGKWVLLANAYDETQLRNAIVLDGARNLGLEWTPSGRFVELYTNGAYRGLYELTEKVNGSSARLDLEDTVDFLLEETQAEREEEDPCVQTDGGKLFLFCKPDEPSAEEAEAVRTFMNSAEQAILNAGTGNELWDLLDIDSWAARYLVDEVFLNPDAELYSAYCYRRGDMLYAGPVWDFDLAVGNPNNLWRICQTRTDRAAFVQCPWYTSMLKNGLFREKVKTGYENVLLPYLEKEIAEGIDRRLEEMDTAMDMDAIRWSGQLPQTYSDRGAAAEALKGFLKNRIALLEDWWINGENYHTVTVKGTDHIDHSAVFLVAHGSDLSVLNDPAVRKYAELWMERDTGEVYRADETVLKDLVLVPANASENE